MTVRVDRIVPFDDIVEDDDGQVMERYRGANLLVTVGERQYTLRKYADEHYVSCADCSIDDPNADALYQWAITAGYSGLRVLSDGYLDLYQARLEVDCWGKPKRQGDPCPRCGIRLFRLETNQCVDCGWRRSDA
jgi:hypothetical protein